MPGAHRNLELALGWGAPAHRPGPGGMASRGGSGRSGPRAANCGRARWHRRPWLNWPRPTGDKVGQPRCARATWPDPRSAGKSPRSPPRRAGNAAIRADRSPATGLLVRVDHGGVVDGAIFWTDVPSYQGSIGVNIILWRCPIPSTLAPDIQLASLPAPSQPTLWNGALGQNWERKYRSLWTQGPKKLIILV